MKKNFISEKELQNQQTEITYIAVESFPKLGMLTALRFLEWVSNNPEGVISLPTGKTPEYFIKWTLYLLRNWDTEKVKEICSKHGLIRKPVLNKLRFVQIDEFYPISSEQTNSFNYYVQNYYIRDFGLDPDRALLINCDKIALAGNQDFHSVFPENKVDLSLRYRKALNAQEQLQQESIFLIDNWCSEYEKKIREMGGIGFFLGGIGPDGHIAFNTRGSDHYSTTRLTATNFETQAVAASDLGGIDIARNRLVITIGLSTITYNPNAVAIIFAASEAKAHVVKDALENKADVRYPATALQTLPNARFYITQGAGVGLKDSIDKYYTGGGWDDNKSIRSVIDYCNKNQRYASFVSSKDLKLDSYCSLIPGLDELTIERVKNEIICRLNRGLLSLRNETILHTGPHHDDIMLGIMPYVNRHLRSPENKSHFAILTSGFTAVTNHFVSKAIEDTRNMLNKNEIQMIKYPDFFEKGYQYRKDKDVYHYLNHVALNNSYECRRGLCHRIVRCLTEIFEVKDLQSLQLRIDEISEILNQSYDGQKNPPPVQTLKGMMREFEEELVWAHSGVKVQDVHHMRSGFYTGDIFTDEPEERRDVAPILNLLRDTNPSIISLALDPEGSGPDTHYKVLQAIAQAIREWRSEKDLSHLRIWGYRNVWFKFHPSEVNIIIPVSMNALSLLNKSFNNCYLSQVDAPFPSYQHDGTFSDLSQKIWVEQLKEIQLLLGKSYFYENSHPLIRATHGLIYLKEMRVDEFLSHARELEKSTEG